MAADADARKNGFTLKWSRSMRGGGTGEPEMQQGRAYRYSVDVVHGE
jgi:hypothetical protein